MPIVQLQQVNKSYVVEGAATTALHAINLSIQAGERVAIMGASGSGKSTLMNILGLLDRPTTGSYILGGQSVADLTEDARAALRNRMIGFVFQAFFLLPRLSILQNVGLPLHYQGCAKAEITQRAQAMLSKVGLTEYAVRKPNQLSGGQQQRAAIARALIANPAIILADEPTGALDSHTGQAIMDLFIELNEREQRTVIIITHDAHVAAQCNRIVQIQDGRLV